MQRTIAFAALAALAAAALPRCSQSTPGKQPPATDECGDLRMATSAIINGTGAPDPAIADLDESQRSAVGAVLINGGGAMCTGTLVAPNIVLTASHCVYFGGIRSVTFVTGDNMVRPDATFSATEWHPHPGYRGNAPEFDVAVLVLRGDTARAGITPIPVSCATTRLLGKYVQSVGFGVTDAGGGYNTRKWWTVLTVDTETAYTYGVYGDGRTGICEGDSGGPLLFTRPDGEVYVMGAASVTDSEDCLGHGYYARTDYFCDFLKEYLPQDPCAGETAAGRCDGQTAVWCEAQAVAHDDCAAKGWTCGAAGDGSARCLPPADPCGGETLAGRCDGQAAVWCEGGTVSRVACEGGTLCGALEDGLSRCVEECALIGARGRCDELGRARWCEGIQVRTRDCAACGQACGYDADLAGYYCL